MDDKNLLRKELREFLPVESKKEVEWTATVPIIFDKKQCSIRIPKKLVNALGIKKNKDKFYFEAIIPLKYSEDDTPKLTGRLVRGD